MDRRFLGPKDVDVIGQAVCRSLNLDPMNVTSVHLHLSVGDMPSATVDVLLPGSVLTEIVAAEMTNLREAAAR